MQVRQRVTDLMHGHVEGKQQGEAQALCQRVVWGKTPTYKWLRKPQRLFYYFDNDNCFQFYY